MVLTCAKIPRPWGAFCRTLSSRVWSDLNANRGHPSTTSDSENSSNGDSDRQDEKKNSKRRLQHDSKNSKINRKLDENSPIEKVRELAFDDFVAEQMHRARRSLLIRIAVKSPNVYDEVYSEICKQLRNFDISVIPSPSLSSPIVHSPDGIKTFFLLETTAREPLDRFIQQHARSAVGDNRLVPSRSRILHFTNEDWANNSSNSRGERKGVKIMPGTDAFTLNKALRDCLWVSLVIFAVLPLYD